MGETMQYCDGETWDGLLMRLAELTEEHERRGGQSGVPVCMGCGELVAHWTLIDGTVHAAKHWLAQPNCIT